MVLVTGGTGFLGAHLLEQLLQNGEQVRCLCRNKESKYLHRDFFAKIEWVKGDILDVVSLETAMQGVEQVYHCAGKISFDPADRQSLSKINIEGTANVVNSCISQGIKKLLHVSSVAALGRAKPDEPITENNNWEDHSNNSAYAKSKYLAEMEVQRGIGEGLSAVIVNPSILIGPSLYWKEGAPKLIKNIADGFSYYTSGVNGFADVRDAASLMICLMNDAVTDERFILNTDNWSYQKLFVAIHQKLGMKKPLKPAGHFMGKLLWRMAWLKKFFTGKKQLVTRETTRTAYQKVYYDNSKIIRQFPEFKWKPLEETIADACAAYLQQHKSF